MGPSTHRSFRHKLTLMRRNAATAVAYCAPAVGMDGNSSQSGGVNWKIKTRLANTDAINGSAQHRIDVNYDDDDGNKYNLLQTQAVPVALNIFAGFLPFTVRWSTKDEDNEAISRREEIRPAASSSFHSNDKKNKSRMMTSSTTTSDDTGVTWSVFTILQLAAFVAAHGYGALKVAAEASVIIVDNSSKVDLCVVTLGSCSVVGELCILAGTLAFIYDAPQMKILLEKMRAFPVTAMELQKLRVANCRCVIAWLLAVTTLVGAINVIKYGMPSPIELRILTELANGVSAWPRWMGLLSVVLLDTLFVAVVQGVSKVIDSLNGDLETLLPAEPLQSLTDSSRRGNRIDDIFSPDTPKEAIDAIFGRKTKTKPEILEDLRLRYVGLCEIVANIQSAFSHYLVATILNAGLNMTVTLYLLLTHSVRAVQIGHVKLFMLTAGITGFSLVRIYAICVVASGPGNKVSKAQRILSKYSPLKALENNNNQQSLSLISDGAIIKFHEELQIAMPLISAGGYFLVSRKLLLSIAATVDTYLIILLQFSISSEMGGGDGFHHTSLACMYSRFNVTLAKRD